MTSMHLEILPAESWWGGLVNSGHHQPFGDGASCDLAGDLRGNQGAPLFLSNRGRYGWSEAPVRMSRTGSALVLEGPGEVEVRQASPATLRGAYLAAQSLHFPPSGRHPAMEAFSRPQYNTWIEMGYHPTEDRVLRYAAEILDHGFPPGALILDDNWQEDYGTWRFHPGRFPDPARMIAQLHRMGFRVMLWICPFVSPDSLTFRELRAEGLLVRRPSGDPAIRRWWNGYSAVLDLSHPQASAWFHTQCRRLREEYIVDGFKLDAGDPEFYRPDDVTAASVTPHGQCRLWGEAGIPYSFNELRAAWKLGGAPLLQRLRDKRHDWGNDGLKALIPHGLVQGLLGYPFSCADMVGGGLDGDFRDPAFVLDQELFVRYAQCAALFPAMQFSLAPWRVLDPEHLAACQKALQVRMSLVPEITRWVQTAAATGEPILRPLNYQFPDPAYAPIRDQFLFGDRILVAPVLAPGQRSRPITFPPGRWRGEDGVAILGPTTRAVDAPLERLPWFRREG